MEAVREEEVVMRLSYSLQLLLGKCTSDVQFTLPYLAGIVRFSRKVSLSWYTIDLAWSGVN